MVVGDADLGCARGPARRVCGKSAIWWGAQRRRDRCRRVLRTRCGNRRSGAPSRFFFVAHLGAKVFGFRGSREMTQLDNARLFGRRRRRATAVDRPGRLRRHEFAHDPRTRRRVGSHRAPRGSAAPRAAVADAFAATSFGVTARDGFEAGRRGQLRRRAAAAGARGGVGARCVDGAGGANCARDDGDVRWAARSRTSAASTRSPPSSSARWRPSRARRTTRRASRRRSSRTTWAPCAPSSAAPTRPRRSTARALRTARGRPRASGATGARRADALNNLADLRASQGDLEEAERLYADALARREAALGAEHPATAASVNNLAVLLLELGGTARRCRCCGARRTSRGRRRAPPTPALRHRARQPGERAAAARQGAEARTRFARALKITARDMRRPPARPRREGGAGGARSHQAVVVVDGGLRQRHLSASYLAAAGNYTDRVARRRGGRLLGHQGVAPSRSSSRAGDDEPDRLAAGGGARGLRGRADGHQWPQSAGMSRDDPRLPPPPCARRWS